MTHSPEPWKVYQCDFVMSDETETSACGFVDGEGNTTHLSDSRTECGHVLDLGDAERIVACVNALKNIPTEELVSYAKMASHPLWETLRRIQQRLASNELNKQGPRK